MADAAIAALQKTINRYAGAGGFARVATDGVWGPNTRAGLSASLRWLVDNRAIDQAFREAAARHQLARLYDSTNPTERAFALAQIALFLGNVANSLGLKETSGAALVATKPPAYTPPALPPTPGARPIDISPPALFPAASISVLGLKMPKWALYVGGGALALMVIGLVVTRKKPSSPVAGAEWWEADDVDEDVKQIHRKSQKQTEQLVREVSSSKRAAMKWLEQVGSYPSSDSSVRKITAAAERRAARG